MCVGRRGGKEGEQREIKGVLEERRKKNNGGMEGERGQNEKKERRERGYLSVQAKLVLFNAFTHKPERQKNNNN